MEIEIVSDTAREAANAARERGPCVGRRATRSSSDAADPAALSGQSCPNRVVARSWRRSPRWRVAVSPSIRRVGDDQRSLRHRGHRRSGPTRQEAAVRGTRITLRLLVACVPRSDRTRTRRRKLSGRTDGCRMIAFEVTQDRRIRSTRAAHAFDAVTELPVAHGRGSPGERLFLRSRSVTATTVAIP